MNLPQAGAEPGLEEESPAQAATVERTPRLGYLDEGARADRQKPSPLIQKKRILDFYLLPRFGELRLDAITNAEVAKLKAELVDRSPKTVNNVLVVLNAQGRAGPAGEHERSADGRPPQAAAPLGDRILWRPTAIRR